MFKTMNGSDVYGVKTHHVWVDRKSVLGNPFVMKNKNDDVERAQVIAKYRKWLWEKMQTNTPQLNELKRLLELEKVHGTICLLCWCKPRACHGDVIVNCLSWMKSKA